MKEKNLLEIMNNLDDSLIEEHFEKKEALKKSNRKKPASFRWLVIAACLCLSAIALAVAIPMFREDPVPEDTDEIFTSIGDEAPETIGIWTYNGTVGNTSNFSKSGFGDKTIQLSISADGIPNYDPKDDICSILFGQYLSSIYSFDYEAHFALFPETLVEEEFVKQIEGYGLTYDEAMKNIENTSATVVGFNKFKLSYKLDSYENMLPDSEEFSSELEGYTGWFEKAGVSIQDISEFRIYYFTDFQIIFNDTYTQVGDIEWDSENGFKFFKYNDQWHLWPSYIENDLSVDLASTDNEADNEADTYYQTASVKNTITAIEGEYISFGNNNHFFAPGIANKYKIGDIVSVEYYCNFGITLNYNEKPRPTLYKACSVTKVTETFD